MNEELLTRLRALQQHDIDTRDALLREGRLYGGYAEEMQAVHACNAQALDDIIRAHGWPGISRVGLEGSRMAWQVAQHAIGLPVLQRRFLVALTAAVAAGDAPLKQQALLEDRIRFNEGRPQRYGTVLDWDASGQLGCELEAPAHVDARRAEVGLSPFEQGRLDAQRAVEAEGGAPPADLAAYWQARDTWARQAGWR